ncbi:MAG TPA: hypothetical protein VNN15_06760 [Solirubrobacterales bacterium]|nr:hypothetical protein [Solirubrobacterales bacterium]
MQKKLILACMAIAALAAFVIAPAAQAGVLTENGVAVAVGSSITAKNTGTIKFTGGFNISCEVAHMQGTVTANSGGVIAGEVPVGSATLSNAGGAACSSALGATTVKITSKLCVSIAKGSDTYTVTGCSANVKFDLTAAGTVCEYETASVSGSFTTNSTPVSGTVSEQPAKEVGGKFFCPDEGKIDLSGWAYTTGGVTGLTVS